MVVVVCLFLLLHPIVHLPFFLVLCFCLFHFGTNHVSGSPFLPFALPIISQLFQFHFNSVPPSSFSLYRLVSLQVGRLGNKKNLKEKNERKAAMLLLCPSCLSSNKARVRLVRQLMYLHMATRSLSIKKPIHSWIGG